MGKERGPAMSMSEWARRQRELLKLERDEEKSRVSDTIAQLSPAECVERGVSLLPLAVAGLSTGLYGRACVTVCDPKGRSLPAHRLGAGDEVRLYSTKGSKGGKGADAEEGVSEISGIVGKVTETTVEVISEDADEAGSLRPPLRLDVVASEATHKKLMLGLDALEKYPIGGGGPAERVISVLFGSIPPSAVEAARTPPSAVDVDVGGDSGSVGGNASSSTVSSALSPLNDSQREAVEFALATRDVALIHGPPGTGKTTSVVALVREAVSRGWRCLVCAPSNVAVDGILERLVAAEAGSGGGGEGGSSGGGGGGRRNGDRLRVARMGHPARLLPQVLEHSMEALVSRHEGTAIVKDVRTEIDKLLRQLYGEPGAGAVGEGGKGGGGGGKTRPRVRGADRKSARQEVKALRKEARAREGKVVQEVLRSRDVVLATCVGAATYSLRDQEFDLVVIDEAAQALEAACWIPILKGGRLVLAGDHKQLAPTVKSREAEAGTLPNANSTRGGGGGSGDGGSADGLGLTMFDRVLRDLGQQVCRMLDVQYRMNRDICDWASTEMYGGLLRAHPSCAERELPDLPHTDDIAAADEMDMWSAVMLLIDTTGCDMPEEEAGGGSRRNEREAEVAVRHVRGLLEAGVLESEVAVISPYNGQVNLLKQLLRPEHPGVEVRSVDGFQGGEKEAIVLSLVRSNPGKTVGFLADARRLNVAVTRAKRHVAVICDAECCGSDAFIGRLLRHIEDRGEYRSALELDLHAQPDGGSLGEPPGTAFGGAGTVNAAAAVAAATATTVAARGSGSGSGSGSATRRGREGLTTSENKGANENFSDDDVLKRVHEFAQRGASKREQRGVGDNEEEELPTELTARQRALVHETAERLGLGHASRGEGPRRAVVLSKGGGGRAGAVVGEGEPSHVVVDHSSSSSSSSEVPEAVGDSLFAVLTGDEGSERDKDGDDDDDDDDGDKVGAAQEVQAPSTASAGRSTQGANTLLAALHAERASRRPAVPPPPPQAGRKNAGKGKAAAAGGGGGGGDGGGGGSGAGPDDRGFTIDIPGGGGPGSGAKKSAPKKGASSSKKGKKKTGGGGGGGVAGARAAGKSNRGPAKASGGKGQHQDGGDRDDDDDDDLRFLDAQIKKERASEPCYASLLRSTTEAMRANNPRWAAAEDKGRPSKSFITGARRTQLKGALETKLTEKEKKRSKSAAEKGEKP